MKTILLLICLTLGFSAFGQTVIKGSIKTEKGEPVEFANIFIKDSYDGTSSDVSGNFEFETFEEGEQILVVKMIGFETAEIPVTCNDQTIEQNIVLKEEKKSLDPVVISAGAFEASDEKKSVVLRPLDIVTTAGAGGDIFQAMQTLPGAQQVGEQEGLFVRGGSAAETKTIIDEMIVQNPFFSSVPDVPQRGRFSPFLFKGTVFSTGGYSALYGQALSSALVLNTVDMFKINGSSVGILPIGGSLSHTKSWEKTSVSVSAGYTHLGFYFKLINQLRDWKEPPQGSNATLTIRQKAGKKGLFKFYGTYSQNKLSVSYPSIDDPQLRENFQLSNKNVYINSSYKHYINDKWNLFTGVSYTINNDDIDQTVFQLVSEDQLSQAKVVATRYIGKHSQLKFGGEVHDQIIQSRFNGLEGELNELYSAAFAEGDIFITPLLAARVGMRFENSDMLGETNLAPRTSLAYKTGEYSQVSAAYGIFYQTPESRYLFGPANLTFENASHQILNYQWMDDYRTFRVEAYNKDYDDLVLFGLDTLGNFENLSNDGSGYARGIDVFYRDKKTLKNTDFWISYSYLDTKRRFLNFPIEAAPTFTSNHTLSVVYKHWFEKISTSAGFTYSHGSGRPYFNPNLSVEDFHSERTPFFSNLSLNASHLTSIFGGFTVIFVSVDNVFNRENVFSYRFSTDGSTRASVGPPNLRSFFVGLFVSFDHDKKKEEEKKKSEKVE